MPSEARPFLRWAGGKTQLLPKLLAHVPAKFETYREPFLGGGALFFALRPKRSVLSDSNRELVTTFQAIRDDVEEVIVRLRWLADHHSPEQFERVRGRHPTHAPATAARMIYLNKTGFNGLYRVNKAGKFNNPLGKPRFPPCSTAICDERNLRACSSALSSAFIEPWDFRTAIHAAESGDFVYSDPPYVPSSKTANFTAYTADGFGTSDRADLAREMARAAKRGAHVLLSSADNQTSRKIYAGLKHEKVSARRNISSNGDGRGAVGELLCTYRKPKER